MNSTYVMLFDSSKREQQSWRLGFDFFLHFLAPDSKIKRDIGAKGSEKFCGQRRYWKQFGESE